MNNAQNAQHEIEIDLDPGQTVLVFGKDVVDDLHTKLIVGYYAREDIPGGSPFKIALRAGINCLYEAGLTELQFTTAIRHLAGWFKNRRRLPHGVSDIVFT